MSQFSPGETQRLIHMVKGALASLSAADRLPKGFRVDSLTQPLSRAALEVAGAYFGCPSPRTKSDVYLKAYLIGLSRLGR